MTLTTPARAQAPGHALSPSQVSTFLDCAARWYFQKVIGLPDPPNGGLSLGRAIHTAAAAVMRGKGAHYGELPEYAAALEIFDHAWRDELRSAELAPDENAIALADTGRKMLQLWHAQIAPHLTPAAVELALIGEIGGVRVHAIADLITTEGLIVDLKTAARKPGTISADHAFQLTTYAVLADQRQARLVTITKTAAPSIVQHTIDIGTKERKHAEAIYPLVAAGMQTGLYPPASSHTFAAGSIAPSGDSAKPSTAAQCPDGKRGPTALLSRHAEKRKG